SVFDGQTHPDHAASDQGGAAETPAPHAWRNGPLAAACRARLVELPRRARQQPLPWPFRRRSDPSLAAAGSPTQSTGTPRLDVATHATSGTALSPAPAHPPSVSGTTISRST